MEADTDKTTSLKKFIRSTIADKNIFEPKYYSYARKGRAAQSTQSVVFYIMYKLTDNCGSLMISDNAMKKVATNIDNMIGSTNYHDAFVEHKGTEVTEDRILYVWNECVVPVFKSEGISIPFRK
jgi:hypothetical protein